MENNILIVEGSYAEKNIGTARDVLAYALDVLKEDILECGINDEVEDDIVLVRKLSHLEREDPSQIVSLEWDDYADHSLVVLKEWHEERQKPTNVIYHGDDVIGYSWNIAHDVEKQIETADEDDKQILTELLKDLEEHDGLVIARLSPMGAYIVYDLCEI